MAAHPSRRPGGLHASVAGADNNDIESAHAKNTLDYLELSIATGRLEAV
jgi:hypothetical protein